MKVQLIKLLPLLQQLGGYLQTGIDLALVQTGLDVESVASLLDLKMVAWHPKLDGIDLLDDPTRTACARFLTGVGFKLLKR